VKRLNKPKRQVGEEGVRKTETYTFREILCSWFAYVLEFDGNYSLNGPLYLAYIFRNYHVIMPVNYFVSNIH
jgi:hypothetical protein